MARNLAEFQLKFFRTKLFWGNRLKPPHNNKNKLMLAERTLDGIARQEHYYSNFHFGFSAFHLTFKSIIFIVIIIIMIVAGVHFKLESFHGKLKKICSPLFGHFKIEFFKGFYL
jgi:hypothetical protein